MGTERRSIQRPTHPDTSSDDPEKVGGKAMTLELDPQPRLERAVRDGQMAAVTCAACGCRLEASGTADDAPWFHFGRMGGRDARGDSPLCVDAPHDRSGRAILAA
jgi:hypothetical protein